MATWEARYLGEIFDRPFPQPLPRWQDSDGSDLWVTRSKCFPSTPPGHVPWWPRPEVKLFNVMVHVLGDTTRHAGHADILREGLDGRTGVAARHEEQIDTAARQAHRAKIEQAARAADPTNA